MTELETWLKRAARRLSKDSAARVRSEIQEHYESAREAALLSGASAEAADRSAVAALGDANVANRQYRRVLLTSAEAKMLGDGNREARAICSRPWLKRLLLAIPAAMLVAAVAIGPARILVPGAIGMSLLLAAPYLPVFTPSRGRAFRMVKWAMLIGVCGFTLDAVWLAAACLWPIVWIEWTRVSIRRKLPVAEWPKQLYL